jgi:heme A synthase
MFAKVLIFFLANLVIVYLNYKKEKNIKKSLIALTLLIYILIMGYIGYISLRLIFPLLFAHFLALSAGYFAILIYIFKNRLYKFVFVIPLITFASYFILNFISGSRYEK